ncbi:MAG TPA: D-aminoacylase [Chloroflexota bacterium]
MAVNLLFRNARIVDGTGNPWYRADVAVADGQICGIGHALEAEAAREIDVADRVLAPGFIDMHAHSDATLLAEPRHEPKVFQGVTTDLIGQDGLSYAPVTAPVLDQIRRHLAGLNGDPAAIGWDWTSVGSFLDRFHQHVSVNVAFLVPHNAVRIGAMGWEQRTATAAELDCMRQLVAEGMQDGGFGLSTGLTYPPNEWSNTEEMVALCEVAARYGGIYVTHMRGQGDGLLEPLRESIDIARRAGLPLHISHLKSSRLGSARKLEEVIALLDGARAQGLDVTFDSYQYNAGSSMLHSQLPSWMHVGGPDAEIQRLQSPAVRQQLRELWHARPPAWTRLHIGSVASDARQWMEGQTLSTLIERSGKDEVDFVCDLLLEENLAVSHVSQGGDTPDDLRELLLQPLQMMGSDGLLIGGHLHPRTYGTFARVLQKYVREDRVLRLEEAIRKFASFPAQRLGLTDRGVVKPGMRADLVVFDPEGVCENATYEQPRLVASGFTYVAVNGALVLDQGVHTGATPGHALRHAPRHLEKAKELR